MVSAEIVFDGPVSFTTKKPKKENVQPNSYVLRKKTDKKFMGTPSVTWELYYVDQKGDISKIDVDKVNGLKKELDNISNKEVKPEDKQKIKSMIATYHIPTRNYNFGNFVAIGKSKKGSFVITDALQPCQGVVVRFKNGESAIYHATSATEGEDFENFLKLIKQEKRENIVDIIVFQKSIPVNNLLKAPVLAIILDKHLNADPGKSKIEINRVQVDGHTCILSTNNHIVLSSDVSYFDSKAKVDIKDLPPNAKGFDDANVIRIEQSKKEPDSAEYQKLRSQYMAMYDSDSDDENKTSETDGKAEVKKQPSRLTSPTISNANRSASPTLWNSSRPSSPSLISNANVNTSSKSSKKADEKRPTSPKPEKSKSRPTSPEPKEPKEGKRSFSPFKKK